MRCKYRCPVIGHLKIDTNFPVTTDFATYELEVDSNQIVTHVSTTVAVPDNSMWPSIRDSHEPGVSLHINLTDPFFEIVKQDLRAAEGLLSLFGVTAIDIENAEQEWLPDSEAERGQLQLFSFSRSRNEGASRTIALCPI